MDKKLKQVLIAYTASALCATGCIAGAVFSARYATSLADTLNHLRTIKINAVKTRSLIQEREALAAKVAAMLPAEATPQAIEGAVLARADAIKARMKDVQIVVAGFEQKGNEIELPVTITGNIRNYITFVNDIGYLQSLQAPFFHIQSVSILKSSTDAEEVILFDIKGVLKHLSGPAGG